MPSTGVTVSYSSLALSYNGATLGHMLSGLTSSKGATGSYVSVIVGHVTQ